MTDTRTRSPTAAEAHARRIVRNRYKSIRLGKRVDSPQILAGRLVAYAEDTAVAYPVEPSRAYAEWVQTNFHEKFVELCRTAPLAEKAGAR